MRFCQGLTLTYVDFVRRIYYGCADCTTGRTITLRFSHTDFLFSVYLFLAMFLGRVLFTQQIIFFPKILGRPRVTKEATFASDNFNFFTAYPRSRLERVYECDFNMEFLKVYPSNIFAYITVDSIQYVVTAFNQWNYL